MMLQDINLGQYWTKTDRFLFMCVAVFPDQLAFSLNQHVTQKYCTLKQVYTIHINLNLDSCSPFFLIKIYLSQVFRQKTNTKSSLNKNMKRYCPFQLKTSRWISRERGHPRNTKGSVKYCTLMILSCFGKAEMLSQRCLVCARIF